MSKEKYTTAVMNSDIPRSRKQFLVRKLAYALVKILGFNKPSLFTTEFIQSLDPIAKVKIQGKGTLKFVANHGRLLWRVNTFREEEPETIEWLDSIKEDECLWDVGANVGMYSIYASVFQKCRVVAFEPEAQNFSILMHNIDLNYMADQIIPVMSAVAGQSGIGQLKVPYFTKGGAFNQFTASSAVEESIYQPRQGNYELTQYVYSSSLDDYMNQTNFPSPTHIKIDVDGIESKIVDGAANFLKQPTLRSVLIELNENVPADKEVKKIIESAGFSFKSKKSNWDYREDRSMEKECKTSNYIFWRS